MTAAKTASSWSAFALASRRSAAGRRGAGGPAGAGGGGGRGGGARGWPAGAGRRRGRVGHGEAGGDRGVLRQRDRHVAQRRDDRPEGLGADALAQRPPGRPARGGG